MNKSFYKQYRSSYEQTIQKMSFGGYYIPRLKPQSALLWVCGFLWAILVLTLRSSMFPLQEALLIFILALACPKIGEKTF